MCLLLKFRVHCLSHIQAQALYLRRTDQECCVLLYAGGRCVYLLEGGYDLKALGEAVAETFRGTLGLPSVDNFNPQLLRDEPLDKLSAMLKEAKRIHGL